MSDSVMPYYAAGYKEDDYKNKIIYYESSRGCPFSCSYCLSSVDKHLRFRNTELVLTDLKVFLDNKVALVKFVDRTFNCNREHSRKILRFIRDNDNGITSFHFEIAADILEEEDIRIMNSLRPGLIQLEIGVQSTNQDTIKAIHRVMNLDKLRNNVAAIRKCRNIHMHLDLIAGLPYEDINSFRKSFNDIYDMKPDNLQLGFLKLLHGSLMREEKDKYGIVARDIPPYEVLYTKYLSYDDILKLKQVEKFLICIIIAICLCCRSDICLAVLMTALPCMNCFRNVLKEDTVTEAFRQETVNLNCFMISPGIILMNTI